MGVAADGIISFFLMAEQHSIVYMNHIFFIHSSVDGHVGYFHLLAVVNSAAMNIVHISCWITILFRYMPRGEIAESEVNLFLLFWGPSTFSTSAAPIHIPTGNVGGLPFSHSLSGTPRL